MSRQQVRAVDAWAINELGIPGVVLMENAGRSCAELAIKKLVEYDDPKVCIFCGDGYVIARHLINQDVEVNVVICGDREKVKGDAKVNLDILTGLGVDVQQVDMSCSGLNKSVEMYCDGCDLLVDAVFGTGLNGELRSDYCQLIDSINSQKIPILAVDIPSGLDCDTGEALGTAIRAKYTVTFVAMKNGFVDNSTSAEYTGDVYVASIGVESRT